MASGVRLESLRFIIPASFFHRKREDIMTGASSGKIRIVTDTTAVLSPEYLAAHHVENVPQIILFGEESFQEDYELSYSEFVRRLRASPQLPKTAAPPPGLLVEAYRRQLAEAQTVISIHPSTEVSGTVRSAITAKEEAFPNADIRILDTRTIGSNLATLVMLAVEWAESGAQADEIMSRLQAMIPRGHIYFLVATLEYLQKGGRIGGAAALVGSVLQIKPILQLKDGRVEPLEKIRTHSHALERLKELVVEQCPRSPDAHLSVMNADEPKAAQRLADELKSTFGFAHVPIYNVGASITTHGGPGILAVGFFA
jgi:fatty acid kinase fatty acid binding subunit